MGKNVNETFQVRQGDVFLEKITAKVEIEKNEFETIEKDNGRVVLAYGEATGHAHAFYDNGVSMFKEKNTAKIYLCVDNTSHLKHEEHTKIQFDPGMYEVIRQREYTPAGVIQVAD